MNKENHYTRNINHDQIGSVKVKIKLPGYRHILYKSTNTVVLAETLL